MVLMDERREIRNHIIKIGVIVVAIVTIGISLSYAYYSGNFSGQTEIDETNAARFDLTSTLDTTPAILARDMQLVNTADIKTKAEKVDFTVTNANTSTVNGKYYIYLTDIQLTKNLYSDYFKWELVKVEDSEETEIASGSFDDAIREGSVVEGEDYNVLTTAEDMALNKIALDLNIGDTDSLIFRIWLENDPDVNQVSLTNGSFQGLLKIEAVPVK